MHSSGVIEASAYIAALHSPILSELHQKIGLVISGANLSELPNLGDAEFMLRHRQCMTELYALPGAANIELDRLEFNDAPKI